MGAMPVSIIQRFDIDVELSQIWAWGRFSAELIGWWFILGITVAWFYSRILRALRHHEERKQQCEMLRMKAISIVRASKPCSNASPPP
jgi:hypothetical protein